MSLRKLAVAIWLLSCTCLSAQEVDSDTVFVRDVDIVRTYVPQIKDAGKINTLPSQEKTQMQKADVSYVTWSSPLEETQFALQQLPSATLRKIRQQKSLREGYARIGAGNYTSFLGDLYVPIVRKEDLLFDMSLNHLSSWGKVKLENGDRVRAKNMDNRIGFGLEKNFQPLLMHMDASYRRNDFNYYGLDSIQADGSYVLNEETINGSALRPKHNRDAHNFFDFNVNLISNPRIGGVDYAVDVAYHLTHTYTGLTEHNIYAAGEVIKAKETWEVGGNISIDNNFYNNPAENACFFGNVTDETRAYSILKLAPFYKFKGDFWHVKLGAKVAFGINKGRVFGISPDIDAKVAIVEDIFYLYANITGDYNNNNMRTAFSENRYFRPDAHLDNSYTPLDASLGLKIRLLKDFVFNASAGYKITLDDHLYVNHQVPTATDELMYDNTFVAMSKNTQLAWVTASLTYNWQKKVDAHVSGSYYHWMVKNASHAWHRPNWRVDVGATYHVTDDLRISLNAFLLGKRYALGTNGADVKLKPIFDINLECVYEFNSWLAAFAKLNNIAHQNYQIWYGYNSQKANAMAGLVFSF